MSDDFREAQSKSDRPAASRSGLSGPAAPAVPAALAPAAPVAHPVAHPVPESEADWDADVAAGSDPGLDWQYADAADEVDDADDADDADEVADEPDEPSLTLAQKLRRVPPLLVVLVAGSLGSLFFLVRATTSHITPVPVLLSAGVVSGLIFAVDAAVSSVATWTASRDGRTGQAFLLAAVGGIAGLFSAGSLAGVLLMILALNG
jgi:hypothetical protein